jgi:peroxiredoxin
MSDVPRPPEPDEQVVPPKEPSLPIPVRKPFSQRRRRLFVLLIGLAAVIAVVVAVVSATTNSTPPPRAQTISAEDRAAPVELRRAAEAVGFHPITQPGVGEIEGGPVEAARPPSGDDLLPVGARAPAFALKTPAGRTVRLADYRGKAVLLEFFASWCPHCAAEAPHLAKLARSMPESKYAFVSINGNNETAASVFAYHVYFGLPFPSLLDPAPGVEPVTFPEHGTRGPVSLAYGVGYYPTFYVIDPQGRITWRSDGEQPNALLRQELERGAGA